MDQIHNLCVDNRKLFRAARAPGARELFDSLKTYPLAAAVARPQAMPVSTAPLAELTQLFDSLTVGGGWAEDANIFTRGAIFADGRLDLCKQVVGPEWIGALVDATRADGRQCGIEHFLLGNNVVGDGGAKRIAAMLLDSNAPRLKTLYLAGNAFGPNGLSAIADALGQDTSVESLWLKRNPLGPAAGEALGGMLARNQTLQSLDLVNTGLFDEGVEALVQGLADNTSLRTLYLDANGLTVRSARAFAAYFDHCARRGHTGITGLFLGINRIGDEGAKILASALADYAALVRFDMGANRLERTGLQALLLMAKSNPSLKYLGMGLYKSAPDMGELPNWFGVEGASEIADFLRSGTSLQALEVKDCHIGHEGLSLLAKALENQHSLLELSCAQYGIKDAALTASINACLARNVEHLFGVSMAQFRRKELRAIKHGTNVEHIDSIYRNRM